MKLSKPLKLTINLLCAALILTALVLSLVLAARTGDALGGDIRAGSWFSRLLALICGGFPKVAAAVAVYFFYNAIFVVCRATIKKLAGTRDFTPLLITVALIVLCFFPFRSSITNFTAALELAFPIALGLFATAFMIFALTEGKHFVPSLILYVLACGGHLFVALAFSLLLAAICAIAAAKKRKLSKPATALAAALACTIINWLL